MKCDKHGIEMEWRGSLVKGGMHCSGCELAKVDYASAELHFDPGQLQGSSTGRIITDEMMGSFDGAVPRGFKIPKTPRPAQSVAEAKRRAANADAADAAARNGAPYVYCPYCETDVDKTHFIASSGHRCYSEYCRDRDVMSRGRV